MSVTAIGPALDIDGPLPVAPPFGLLTIPGVFDENAGRALNGVVVDSYPEAVPIEWEPCSAGTYREKEEGEAPPLPRFDPVGLYVPITCNSSSYRNWRDLAVRAELVLEATLSYGAEKILSQGVSGSSNPYFSDAGVSVLGGGAVGAQAGLSYLENAIGATGRRGIIHADPATVAAWGDRIRVVSGHLVSFNGNYIAAGGGYIGADAGANPAAGQSYAFATGPVTVRAGEARLIGEDINGTLDTSDNSLTFRAERYVLASWDTALQAAVLIDWTPA